MKVFISHSSADHLLADLFVRLIRSALIGLRAKDIRCTSVDGHRLPAGTPFEEQLRQEVFEAESLVALLTPASLRSTFVLFELGARWSAKRPLLTVRVGGLAPESLKGPLATLHTADGSSELEVADLLSYLSKILGTELEEYSAYAPALKEFVALSLMAAHKQTTAHDPTLNEHEDAGQHTNVALILSPTNGAKVPRHPLVSGRTDRLHPDFRLWLAVETPDGHLYPQYPLTRSPGGWAQEVRIGRTPAGLDKGYEFIIMLVAVGADANYLFEKHFRGDIKSDDGLRDIRPSDMIILDSRRVLRGD